MNTLLASITQGEVDSNRSPVDFGGRTILWAPYRMAVVVLDYSPRISECPINWHRESNSKVPFRDCGTPGNLDFETISILLK